MNKSLPNKRPDYVKGKHSPILECYAKATGQSTKLEKDKAELEPRNELSNFIKWVDNLKFAYRVEYPAKVLKGNPTDAKHWISFVIDYIEKIIS